MSSRELLEADIALLLLRYDEDKILRTLAKHLKLTDGQLEERLMAALKRRHASPAEKPKSPAQFSLDRLLVGHDSKEKLLRKLYARFENRVFLPDLKDVKTFLEKNRESSSAIKSRASAKSKIFNLLVKLDAETLEKLSSEEVPDNSEFSSLGIISDEILRRDRK